MVSSKHMNEFAFSERCAVALGRRGFKATVDEPLLLSLKRGSYDGQHSLKNLYHSYLLESPDDAKTLIRTFADALAASLEEAAQAQESLTREEGLRLLLPMLKLADKTGDALARPFGPGVSIDYAVDLPTAWRFVDAKLAEAWGESIDMLHTRALDNLLASTKAVEPAIIPGAMTLAVYSVGDGFDAARVLILDRLHPDAKAFSFTIPTRDQLLYLPAAGLPGAFAEALRSQAEQDCENLDNPLSPHLWRYAPGDGQTFEVVAI